MELKDKLTALATGHLPSPAHFLVDVIIKGHEQDRKVIVLLDGDRGVSIEDCATLSRRLGAEIEEQDLIPGRYTLEVSSAGLDHPLQMPRQYAARVGRNLRLILQDGSEISGMLTAAGEQEIELETMKKSGKKQTTKEKITVSYSAIDKALVQVSFK